MLIFVKNLLFIAIVPGFVAGWVPLHWFERYPRWPEGSWRWQNSLGSIVAVIGLGVFLHCVWLFATKGRGTPAPIDPPKKLVHRGLYRWVRNPMYLGVLLVIGGEMVFFLSWHIAVYLLCLSCAFQAFVVLYEEPALSTQFGAMYEDYRREVPRWWPRRPKPGI